MGRVGQYQGTQCDPAVCAEGCCGPHALYYVRLTETVQVTRASLT